LSSPDTVIIFSGKNEFTIIYLLFLKEVSLDQALANCPKFLTADLRKSLSNISVPMWLIVFPYQLKIISLVSFYLTNNLILHQLT